MTPTRELAGQIRDALEPLAAVRNRSDATFYGGTSVNNDIKRSLVFDDQHDDLHAIQRSLALPTGLDRGDVGELTGRPAGNGGSTATSGRGTTHGGARHRSRRRSRR